MATPAATGRNDTTTANSRLLRASGRWSLSTTSGSRAQA
jgi:hypothetical protein